MNRYAIKIGELLLHSDKPITDKQRKEAIDKLEKGAYDGVMFAIDGSSRVIVELD